MPLTPEQVDQLNALNIPLVNDVVAKSLAYYFENRRGVDPPAVYLGTLLASLCAVTPAPDGTRRLYVDTEAGSNDNDGLSAASPLRTIQYAVDKFLPPCAAPPCWALGDDRVIDVKYTAGMSDIKEEVFIPFHAGGGALRIEGDEEVVATLTVSGDFAAVSGKVTRQTLSFSTSPLTAGELDRNAFVRLHDRSIAPSSCAACLDDMPIYSNQAGSVDVVCEDPGIYSAFEVTDGVDVDIVRPRVPWSLPDNANAALTLPVSVAITNAGGPLIVSGFIARGPTDAAPDYHSRCFLKNIAPGGDFLMGPPVILNRISVEGGPNGELWFPFVTGACTLSAVLFGQDSLWWLCSESTNLFVYNVDIDTAWSGTTVNIGNILNCCLIGFHTTGLSLFAQNVCCSLASMDFDGTGHQNSSGIVVIFDGSTFWWTTGLSVVNAGNLPAVSIGASHSGYRPAAMGIAGTWQGSSGNTSVGCRVYIHGNLHHYPGADFPTLSGTGGDVQVGGQVAQAWNAGGDTDPDTDSRYD